MKTFIEWLLITVIAGSVLAFGGVMPLAFSLMETGVFLGLFIVLSKQSRLGKIDLPIPVGVFLILLWVVLQAVKLPPQVIAWLSPSRLLADKPLAALTAGRDWKVLSIYPNQTLVDLFKLLAYCGAYVLAAFSFEWQKRSSPVIRALIFLGIAEAAYGIIQYLTGFQQIFTYKKQFYTEDATGTYINRNHFAGFLELIVPLLVAHMFYLLQSSVHSVGRDVRQRPEGGAGSRVSRISLYTFLVIVLLIAVIFSRSRMGIFSILFSLIFVAFLGQLKVRRKSWMVGMLIILVASASYSLWIGLNPVLERFETLESRNYLETPAGRLPLWQSEVKLIKRYPITGTGLGTFGVAFRRDQNVLVEQFVDHAHNDYLEFASELGLLGVVLLFAPIFFLWGKMIVAFVSETSRYRSSVLLGCVGSTLAILIHSLTDFNLQIPANALVFSVILGIGYKAALNPSSMRNASSSGNTAPGRLAHLN